MNLIESVYPCSSMISKVLRASLAIATQLLAKIPYGVVSGISILNESLSPILTVCASRPSVPKMTILGRGASGEDVICKVSGSLIKVDSKSSLNCSLSIIVPAQPNLYSYLTGIIPKDTFRDVVS